MVSQWEKADFLPAEAKREISAFFRRNLNKIDDFCRVDELLNTVFLSKHQVDRFETGYRG